MFPAHHLSFEFIHGVFSLQKFSTHTHISTLFPFWVLGFLLFLKQSPPPPCQGIAAALCLCLYQSPSAIHTIYLYKELLRTLPNGIKDVYKPLSNSSHCVWARCARTRHHPPTLLTCSYLSLSRKAMEKDKNPVHFNMPPPGSF